MVTVRSSRYCARQLRRASPIDVVWQAPFAPLHAASNVLIPGRPNRYLGCSTGPRAGSQGQQVGSPVSALDKRKKMLLNHWAECNLSRAGSPRSQQVVPSTTPCARNGPDLNMSLVRHQESDQGPLYPVPRAPLARIFHRCSSRGRQSACGSGPNGLKDAEGVVELRRSGLREYGPLPQADWRPQQDIGEIYALRCIRRLSLASAPRQETSASCSASLTGAG